MRFPWRRRDQGVGKVRFASSEIVVYCLDSLEDDREQGSVGTLSGKDLVQSEAVGPRWLCPWLSGIGRLNWWQM